MNSMERVFATVAGTPTDRVPFILNASLFGARLTGASLREHYTDPAVYADGQCAVREAFGPDLLISPFAVAPLGEAWGSELFYSEKQAPTLARPAAPSARAALALAVPDVDAPPSLRYLRGCVRVLAERFGKEVPVVGLLVSPLDLPALIIGVEAWLDALLTEPDLARDFLDRCTEFFVALGNAMLADGATLLAITANFANPGMVPRRVAEVIGRPVLEAALGRIGGPVVLHHGGCRLAPHLDLFLGLPNTVAYFVDAEDSLAEAREKLTGGQILLGNLEGPALDRRTPEEVRRACEAILAGRATDPHFILGTSQADIPLATPPECIAAIRDAVLHAQTAP